MLFSFTFRFIQKKLPPCNLYFCSRNFSNINQRIMKQKLKERKMYLTLFLIILMIMGVNPFTFAQGIMVNPSHIQRRFLSLVAPVHEGLPATKGL